MNELISCETRCPYCGESFESLVDGSVPRQRYVEDCEICCRPIVFDVTVAADGQVDLIVSTEND